MSLPSFHRPLPMLSGEWIGFEEAIAWVQTRDAAFAEEMQDEDGFSRALSSAFREVVGGQPAPFDDEDQARRKLLQVLRHGIVTAQGRRDARDAPLEPISTVEWSGLRFGSDARGNLIAMRGKSRAGGSTWFDITIHAESLLRSIPEPRLFGGLAEAMAAALAAPPVVTIGHVPSEAAAVEQSAPGKQVDDAPTFDVPRPGIREALQGRLTRWVEEGRPLAGRPTDLGACPSNGFAGYFEMAHGQRLPCGCCHLAALASSRRLWAVQIIAHSHRT